MAGRLHREEMPVERLVGTGSVQIQAENSVMLSGGDREVTLISVQAVPEMTQTEEQPGGVAVQGAVHYHFLLGLAVTCHAQHLILVAFKVAVAPGAHRILQFLHSRSFLFCKKGCCAGRVQQPTNLIL